MRNLKSVLVAIMALCLIMCLAVPAFATEATDPTATTEENVTTSAPADTEATEPVATEPVTDEHDHNHAEEGATDTTTTGNGNAAPAKSSTVKTILLVLEVIASVALIVVVLLQSGKESGLGNAISGNSDSYMNKNKNGGMDKLLASATKWVALVWIVITLLLGLIK
jgi:preprotein translocase subunit SecG